MQLIDRLPLPSVIGRKPRTALVIFSPRRIEKTTLLRQKDVSLLATRHTDSPA